MPSEPRSLLFKVIIVLVAEVGVVYATVWVFDTYCSSYISGIEILLGVGIFVVFLFTIVSDPESRNPFLVGLFIITNISAMIILFANIYRWVGIRDTTKGTAITTISDAIYFSAVTWTTLGYGDIVPMQEARWIAASEAITGYVVMGLLIAVLIAMFQRD